jgi:hypothetical protein
LAAADARSAAGLSPDASTPAANTGTTATADAGSASTSSPVSTTTAAIAAAATLGIAHVDTQCDGQYEHNHPTQSVHLLSPLRRSVS